MDAGVKEARGTDGCADADKEMVPAKPFRPVTVTMEVPEEPAWMVTEAGVAEIEKSGVMGDAVTVT